MTRQSWRDCCPHHQVHKAKGQPVTVSDFHSLSFIFLSPCLFISPAPLSPPSSSPGQLRQISRTHSHHAIIYPDSTLRLVFCFCTYIYKNADYVFHWISPISCCRAVLFWKLNTSDAGVFFVFFCGGRDSEDLAAEERRYPEVFVVRPEKGGRHILEDKWKWEIYKEDWSGWSMKRGNGTEGQTVVRPLAKLCLSTSGRKYVWERECREGVWTVRESVSMCS